MESLIGGRTPRKPVAPPRSIDSLTSRFVGCQWHFTTPFNSARSTASPPRNQAELLAFSKALSKPGFFGLEGN
jgi:hypothetical protein